MTVTRTVAITAIWIGVTLPGLNAQPPQSRVAPGAPSRTVTAVTYEIRRTTKIDLVGTPLLPRARGEVEVKTEASGPVRIKARIRDFSTVAQLGPEYLTFVFWAIPPQGRAKNLGELRADDGEVEIEATVDVQTFALIITAEPYFAVTTPSDTVLMENAVRADTRGRTSLAPLTYEIVARGGYVAAGLYTPPQAGKREPPDVRQARNAVAIALLADASKFAAAELAPAQRLLGQVEKLVAERGSQREIISQSRAAVQAAEEARLQSLERRRAAADATARAEAAAREQAALAAAEQEAAARRQAEAERRQAEEERRVAEQAAQAAALEKQNADQAARDATRARDDAEAGRAAAEAATARAEEARAHAEQDRTALRATLLRQFNEILRTRDTERGLIVSVGDVLFATGRVELQPAAREKLARFAGIVLGHPGLRVRAEGYTDATGSDDVNMRLSHQRAEGVGRFLIDQGVAADRIAVQGLGAANPIAGNDTAEGRQQNRRVELIVSGDAIGTSIGNQR